MRILALWVAGLLAFGAPAHAALKLETPDAARSEAAKRPQQAAKKNAQKPRAALAGTKKPKAGLAPAQGSATLRKLLEARDKLKAKNAKGKSPARAKS